MAIVTNKWKSVVSPSTGEYVCSMCGKPIWRGEEMWVDAHSVGSTRVVCDECKLLYDAFGEEVALQMARSKVGA